MGAVIFVVSHRKVTKLKSSDRLVDPALFDRPVDLAFLDITHLVRTLHVIMSRQTPFQDKHAMEYGFQPMQRSVGGVITTVQCLFCVHIGRKKHESPGVKHQRTKNTQLFQFPFQPEAYKNHHESQHHEDWTSYQLLSHQEKAAFFKKKEVSGIHNFLDKDKDSLQFIISRPMIVDDVVGDLFFHPEENEKDNASEPITKANAMKLFKPQEDGSYLVTIKNSL